MKKIIIYSLWHDIYDDRVYYKQAISLSKQYDITLFSSHSSDIMKNDENWIKLIGKNWWKLFNIIKWVLFWIKNESNLMVAHDIDSYITVVMVKLIKWKIKLIFDSHEYYDLYDKSKLNIFWRIVFYIFLYIIKPLTLYLFSWITLVTSDMGDNYLPIKKQEVIYNYPHWAFIDKIKKNGKLINPYKYLIYHWWISQDRWLFEMLKIFKQLHNKDKTFRLILIWPFNTKINLNKCKYDLNKLWISKYVNITWRLSYEETISYLKNDVVKIGFCLFDNVWQMSKTIPIKMLEYLYLKIPQIWSNHINSFLNIINDNWAWISVNYSNLNEETNAIDTIINDYVKYLEKCSKIKNQYTWEHENEKLCNFYKLILW